MSSDQHGAALPPPPKPGSPPPAKPRGGSRWPLVAVGAAALAVVLGLLATVLSLRALDQANDARDIARAAGAGRVGEPPGTGEPAQTSTPPAPATTGAEPPPEPGTSGSAEPSIDPQTPFKEKYVDERLTLRASCNTNLDIDLDKPEVRVSDGEELRFTARCGGNSSYFNLAPGTKGAQVDAATLSAADCDDRIDKGGIGTDINVPARKSVVLCIRTNLTDARERGDTWKMALVQVTDVNDDGTVVLTAKAWDIPL
ncbi:hypothetical protein KBX06_12095 [Micromonospora sp. C31]|uniref:hypothetical protein n=1 Tax=Micromonospora sp. C31 TaxID=2824876 RepID=UPI001B393FDE|nr:hypothetical protein [Micromonospora sp. C31]MBQ1073895.1 hypothetical protein [Micromonospora sp. C31]